MKLRKPSVIFGIGSLVLLLVSVFYLGRTAYAYGARNVEIAITVTDAETGKPISNASIDLWAQAWAGPKSASLTSDDAGGARFVVTFACEDIIRPVQKTVTNISVSASVNIAADGYEPIEKFPLHESSTYVKPEREHLHRVEFNIRLHKSDNK